MASHEVDARRLLCPLPVIRTQDAVARLLPGDEVRILGTDPGMRHDIAAWCRIHGHRLIATHEQGDEIEMVMVVGGGESGEG